MRRRWQAIIGATGLIVGLVIPLVALAGPVSAAGTTFSNSSSIGLQDPNTAGNPAEATLYPSPISVSGESGTISDLTVTLSGIHYKFSQDISALLVGPTGKSLSLFTQVGSNDQSAATNGLNVTLSDGPTITYPYNTALPTSGSVTMPPTDDTVNPTDDFSSPPADTYPSPAPQSGYSYAASTGSATLGSTFDGTNPNGTWDLYVTTDSGGDGTGSLSGGWSLNVTTAASLTSTTTTLSSNNNPSFTSSPGNSVTLIAAVTSGTPATPVTAGTVDFTNGGTTISGCGTASFNSSGQATCTTTFSSEGAQALNAVYSGATGLVASNDTLTQLVNNHTTVNGTTYANPGAITLANLAANPSQASPYPSDVFVSGVTGTVSHLSVTLSGITLPYANDLNALLVGPGGQSLVLVGNVGPDTSTTNANNVSVTFDDDSSTSIPQSTPLGSPNTSVTTKPVDYSGDDTNVFPAPAPTSPGIPAPQGTTTLGQAFDGISPNGTWSLYVEKFSGEDGGGSVAGGWSLNISTGSQAATTTTVSTNPNPSFTTNPGNSVMATATVTAGGSPVTSGTVAFTAAGTTITGCGAAALNGAGQATCTTSFSTEGEPVIEAAYGGTTSYAPSSGSVTQQVDNQTAVSGNTFSNTGAITLPDQAAIPEPSVPYPSQIITSNLGPVTGLTVSLKGITFPYTQDLDALLVGPSGKSLVLLSNVGPDTGTTGASNVSVTFSDAAASAIPQNTALGSSGTTVTTKPVDYTGDDTDTFPTPAPAGPYGTPAPRGSATLGSTFDGTNPNGTWSLNVEHFAGEDGGGSIAGGWSLSFTVASQTVGFTSSAPTNAVVGGATYTPTPTGGASGNPVAVKVDGSSTAGACSISAGTVSFTGAGSCVLDANQVGNANYGAATQVQQTIIVSPPAGSLLISQFRLGGPGGPSDSYVELYNTTNAGINLTGGSLAYSSTVGGGTLQSSALPAETIPARGYVLMAGADYSLGSVAAPDATFGSVAFPIDPRGGASIIGPNGITVIDSVGFTGNPEGFGEGTLLSLPASITTQYAFVRKQVAAVSVNSDNNASDFVLVDPGGPTALAGSITGAPSPANVDSPIQSNAIAVSSLLDPDVAATASPNRVIGTGPTTLTVRRTITNTSTTTTLANMEVQISTITAAGESGTHADLVVQNSTTSNVTVAPGPKSPCGTTASCSVTAEGLTLVGSYQTNGGGLDSELSVPLPAGGLTPGQSVTIALLFTVPQGGSYSFSYNVLANQDPDV